MSRDPIARAEEHWRERGWEAAADGMRLVTTITRVQQLLHQQIDDLLQPDLTFARYEILMLLHLGRRGEMPMSAMGARLQVHPASVTSAVARLERDGYVVRTPGTADRRQVIASITTAGRRRARAATRVLNDSVFGDVGVSRREARQLTAGLDRLREHFGDADEDAPA